MSGVAAGKIFSGGRSIGNCGTVPDMNLGLIQWKMTRLGREQERAKVSKPAPIGCGKQTKANGDLHLCTLGEKIERLIYVNSSLIILAEPRRHGSNLGHTLCDDTLCSEAR